MFTGALFVTAKKWKQPKHSSVVNAKVNYIKTMV